MEGAITQEQFYSTGTKHRLVKFIFVAIFVIMAGIIWWIAYCHIYKDFPPRVCQEDACNATAMQLFDSIDFMVNPCDNFYQFVCGGYIKHAKIPEGKHKISPTLALQEKVHINLKNILKNISLAFDIPPKPFSALADLYSKCMDVVKVDNNGLEEARKVFQEAGGWPVLDKTPLPDTWTFLDTTSKLRGLTMARNSLIKTSVARNLSGIVIKVEPPSLGLAARELAQGVSSPAVSRYLQYMTDITALYGVSVQEAKTTMRRVLDIESAIAELKDSKTDNSFSSEYTLQNLLEMPSLSWVPWAPLLQSMVPTSYGISSEQSVIVVNPEFLIKLGELLTNKQASDIVNYVMWKAADELAPLVSEQMRLRHELQTGDTPRPRWQWCLQIVSSKMDVAVSSLYVTKYMTQRVKTSAKTMVSNINQELVNNIRESTLDVRTKLEVSDQARNVRTVVAYPDEMLEVEKVETYYKELNPNKESFLRAVLDILKWQHDVTINKSVEDSGVGQSWSDLGDLSVPKAVFSVTQKRIIVNAGLLQPPLFSPDQPLYINYGSIGYLVAHHYAHTIDNQSTKTSTESVTYRDGLKVAYRAYKKVADQLAEPEPRLPKLQQFTPGQLFMISMANMLCVKHRSNDVSNNNSDGNEANQAMLQMERKINGLVNNSADFKRLFSCKDSLS